jgi:hypothetical protein
MAPPSIITKVTGHVATAALAGDLRYLDETSSRGDWQFQLLTAEEISDLIGKNRKLFIADPGGPIIRIPAEILPSLDRNGVMHGRATGTISSAYAARMAGLRTMGKKIYERVVIGIKPLENDHGFHLARPRGTVAPLTWTAQLRAQEMGWTASAPTAAGRPILSHVLRDSIRPNLLVRRTVKTMTGGKKVGRAVAAHNLVVAPSLAILAQIKRAGQPVDQLLETAARRALEKMERKIGGKITAVASTHLQDSTGIRPHLHVRLSAYDSNGKYIRLFDRAGGGGGGSGGGRCILQPEIERQIRTMIERWEPRKRD